MARSDPDIRLPRHWPRCVKSAYLCAVALARTALVQARSSCAHDHAERIRLAAECERLNAEVAMLSEELRIKDARLGRVAPSNRPHYTPIERLRILALKTGRG